MKRLVLVGAGHAHVQVLRAWIEAPLPDVELVLVSPSRLAPYSGMVPGWLQGVYRFDEICIDAASLAHAAAARFVEDEVSAIEPGAQWLRLRRHDALRYDVASLNIGSTLYPPQGLCPPAGRSESVSAPSDGSERGGPSAAPGPFDGLRTGQAKPLTAPSGGSERSGRGGPPQRFLSMRPLGELRAAWDALLAALDEDEQGSRRVIAAGAGPAGVESLLAVMARLRRVQPRMRIEGLLVTKDDDILPSHAPAVRRAVRRALHAAGASVATNVDAASLETHESDIVLWATGAQAHRWPADSGLDVDAQRFVRVDAMLRSTSHPTVFATGDCAAWSTPLPKAGVVPVRQGPVLAHNLRAALTDSAMASWTPQRRHLALLSTADGRAIASWGPWSATGHWVWRWKDRIDRRFVERFAASSHG